MIGPFKYKAVYSTEIYYHNSSDKIVCRFNVVLLENAFGKRKIKSYGESRGRNTAENHSWYLKYAIPWKYSLLTTNDVEFGRSLE